MAVSDHELIRNAIARYAIGIDNLDWDLFARSLADDVKIVYGERFGTMNGSSEAVQRMKSMSGSLPTQHAMTTQLIELTGDATAEAITYCCVTHWGPSGQEHKMFTTYGYYADKLVKNAVDGKVEWRIAQRTAVPHGPIVGDQDLATESH